MKNTPNEITEIMYACAKGSYQSDLLDGRENWSGSSLKGKASSFGKHYACSRSNLLDRINDTLPRGWWAETDLIALPVGDNGELRIVRTLLVHASDGEMYIHA